MKNVKKCIFFRKLVLTFLVLTVLSSTTIYTFGLVGTIFHSLNPIRAGHYSEKVNYVKFSGYKRENVILVISRNLRYDEYKATNFAYIDLLKGHVWLNQMIFAFIYV